MYKILSGFTLVFGMLIGSIVMKESVGISDTVIYLPCIFISLFFLLLSTRKEYGNKLSGIVTIALILRFAIMLWNVYGRDIYCLPGVGTDTEGFHASAVTISNDLSYISANLYGTYYSKYLGLLYYCTGPSYLMGSYINFLYSAISISILYKILSKLEKVDGKIIRFSIIVFSLEPNHMIIGSSLRRESMMILFIMASLFFILQWSKSAMTSHGVIALLFVLCASILHAGVIGIAVGYIVLLLFYSPVSMRWKFRRNGIFMGIIIVLGAIIVLTRFSSIFLSKILVDDQTTFFRRANRAVGEAAYLTNISIKTFRDLIIYLPIKLLYFIAAPVPWGWRGITDTIAFVLDAVIYILLTTTWIRSLVKARKKPIAFALGISCLSSIIIYAIGCSNSANAMRHRLKLLGMMIVITCILHSMKNSENKDNIAKC